MHVNIKGAGVSCDRVQAHISRVPHLELQTVKSAWHYYNGAQLS